MLIIQSNPYVLAAYAIGFITIFGCALRVVRERRQLKLLLKAMEKHDEC